MTYLHRDQAGSTRLLTGCTGTVTGKCSYSAYGTPTCEGTSATPLGYDGQYTSSDTGLIYLRAREYDPATAQFLSVDPLVWLTRAPYTYAGDNPLNFGDPSGRAFQICVGGTVSLGFLAWKGMCATSIRLMAKVWRFPAGLLVALAWVQMSTWGQVGAMLKRQRNMAGHLRMLEEAHKQDLVATRVHSLVGADHALRLWLVVRQACQPASGPRRAWALPTRK